MRACLDIPGDVEGGRIVNASQWLRGQTLPLALVADALVALAHHQTYRAPSGAWSLTPLKD